MLKKKIIPIFTSLVFIAVILSLKFTLFETHPIQLDDLNTVKVTYAQTTRSSPLIIDHTAVALFDQIPDYWLNEAKKFALHYAHTSHGEQIAIGMQRLEDNNPKYAFDMRPCALSGRSDVVNFFEGTISGGQYDLYVDHNEYWNTEQGLADTGGTLSSNLGLNASIWTFCYQHQGNPDTYGSIQPYLDAMKQLEQNFPNINFIYVTGHRQAYPGHHTYGGPGYETNGYWAHLNNEHIRQYCRDNNKILFDFGDIDCWHNGTQSTYDYNDQAIPHEHDDYNINEAGHTAYENCDNKGKAFWVLMAKLAGWGSSSQPNILVNKQADQTEVSPGGYITYTLELYNDSDAPAMGVVATDQIPSGASYIQDSATQGGQYSNGQIVWLLGTLGSHQRQIVRFEIKFD